MQRSSPPPTTHGQTLAFFRRPVFGFLQMLAAVLMAFPPSSFTWGDEAGVATITLWTDNDNTAVPGQVVPLYAQLRDAGGAPLAGVTLYFSVTSGNGTLGMASATTDWQGVCAVSFMGDGNSTIVSATDGYATDPATGTCTIAPGAPHTYAINWYADASSLWPGNSATLTAQLVDTTNGANTVVPGVVLNFSLPTGDGGLSGYSGTTDGNGCVSLTFWGGSSPSQINAWDALGLGASSACMMEVISNTINPTTPVYSISLAADQNPLPQQQPTTLRCRVMDQNGTPVSGDTVYFQVANGDANLGSLSAQTDSEGWCSVPVTSGTMPSLITVSDSIGYATPNTLTLAVPTSSDTYSLSLVPGTNPLTPGTPTTITVTVRDETLGVGVGGFNVDVSAQGGGSIAESGGMSSATVTTAGDGTATVTLFGAEVPSTVVAGCNALNLSQTLTVGVQRQYNISVSQSATSVSAYQPVTFNVQISDATTGQPLQGITPEFSMESGSGWFDPAAGPTNEQGFTSATFVNSGSNATLVVMAPGEPTSAQSCSISVYTVSSTGSMSVWADGGGSLFRGDSSAVIAQVWDASGNPLNNGSVTFTVTDGNGTLTHEGLSGAASLTVQTNSNGVCSVQFVGGTQFSSVSVSAPDTGDPVVKDFAVTPEFYRLEVTQTGASTLAAGETCALNARVYNITRQAYMENAALSFAVSGDGSVSVDYLYGFGTSGFTRSDGNCHATFTGGSEASTLTITSDLVPGAYTANFSVVQGPPPPHYQLTMSPATATATTSVAPDASVSVNCMLVYVNGDAATPMENVEISFSVPSGQGYGTLSAASGTTNTDGLCGVTFTGGTIPTTVTARAETYGTASSLAFTVASAQTYTLSLAAPPADAWLPAGNPTSLSMKLLSGGTPAVNVSGAPITFSITSGDGRLRLPSDTSSPGSTSVTTSTGTDGVAAVTFLFGTQTTVVGATHDPSAAAASHTFQKPTGTGGGPLPGGSPPSGGGPPPGGSPPSGGGGATQTASLVGVESRIWTDGTGGVGRAAKDEYEHSDGGSTNDGELRRDQIAEYKVLRENILHPPLPPDPFCDAWEPVGPDAAKVVIDKDADGNELDTGHGQWHYRRHVHDPGEAGTATGVYDASNPRFAVTPDDAARIQVEGDNCTLHYTDDGHVGGTSNLLWTAPGAFAPDSATITARANDAFAIANFPESEREKEGSSTLWGAGGAQHRADTIYVHNADGSVTSVVVPSGGHQMFWLSTSDGKEAVQDITMTVLKTSGAIGHRDQATVTAVTLTILAGHKVSTQGGTDNNGIIRLAPEAGRFEGLAPVEVVQPTIDALGNAGSLAKVDEVRFSRWQNAFYTSLTTPKPNFIDTDKDRFVIRIPASAFPNQSKITAQVATKRPLTASDQEDTVEHPDTPEEFTKAGDFFESKPMILVPNEADDAWDAIPPPDGTTNDRTHRATPGGKIEVTLPLQGSPKYTFAIKPYTQKIIVETYVVHSPAVMGQLPPMLTTYIDRQMTRAKEVYKQMHVKIEHHGPYSCDIGDALMNEVLTDRGDGQDMLLVYNPNGMSLHNEGKQVFDRVLAMSSGAAAPNVVRLVFFPCKGIDYNADILGLTVRSGLGQTLFGKYEGFVAMQAQFSSRWRVAAHEIGHTINLEHRPLAGVERCMLMTPADDQSNYGSMTDEFEMKRFHPDDLGKIEGSTRAPFLQKK